MPVLFFSASQSKLPGYILPAIPAGPLLVAEYVRRRVEDEDRPALWTSAFHALCAAAPIVPAVFVQYLLQKSPLPRGAGLAVVMLGSAVVAIGIFYALRKFGLTLLRTATFCIRSE